MEETFTEKQEQPLKGGRMRRAMPFAVLGLLVVGVGGAITAFLYFYGSAAGTLATLADWLPLGYAFGAGMVASVNPCGFFMLPSYVAYHLGTQEQGFHSSPAPLRLLRAVALAMIATLGFLVVFSVIGLIIALGGRWLVGFFPFAGVAIGVALAGVGLWLLITRKSLGIMAASRIGIAPRKNLLNVFLFGIAYAVCSLSCTLPVFLVVVGGALASKGMMASFGQFLGYALGMGSILVAVTVGAALFKGAVARFLRTLTPYVHSTAALFMLGAGLYLIYYWLRYGNFFS